MKSMNIHYHMMQLTEAALLNTISILMNSMNIQNNMMQLTDAALHATSTLMKNMNIHNHTH